MNTPIPTIKLPNCSPFIISVERLIKLYSEIQSNGYLQLDCLNPVETSRESTIQHVLPTQINTQVDYITKRQPIRNSEETNPKIKNITKRLLGENVLKRSKDPYEFPETDQDDNKQVKIARTSNSSNTQRTTTGDFNNVMASLITEQNLETDVHNSPNKLPSQPDKTASNVRMDFEYEATSPTRITVNIQDTVNHIKDI
ncbi:hypothetical protein LOD99_348 [Oopsacas minuta]|uniref:Uncharacterized protein n=1 Tax=Oopsacas minuta TaxID=111878 RepID=A0AAV7K9B2_9METZ|nr:hypothetical protein LOD99_348 [Oopsacas minuta]